MSACVQRQKNAFGVLGQVNRGLAGWLTKALGLESWVSSLINCDQQCVCGFCLCKWSRNL